MCDGFVAVCAHSNLLTWCGTNSTYSLRTVSRGLCFASQILILRLPSHIATASQSHAGLLTRSANTSTHTKVKMLTGLDNSMKFELYFDLGSRPPSPSPWYPSKSAFVLCSMMRHPLSIMNYPLSIIIHYPSQMVAGVILDFIAFFFGITEIAFCDNEKLTK